MVMKSFSATSRSVGCSADGRRAAARRRGSVARDARSIVQSRLIAELRPGEEAAVERLEQQVA